MSHSIRIGEMAAIPGQRNVEPVIAGDGQMQSVATGIIRHHTPLDVGRHDSLDGVVNIKKRQVEGEKGGEKGTFWFSRKSRMSPFSPFSSCNSV
jgi:hypothetical protein